MSVLRPEFSNALQRLGFRLFRFEVYNWGTFHEHVWGIEPRGDNALLTGDIGSGKSTLVDALTTLLVAPQKIAYNRAAGGETRERTLRSYVAGHYKSERGETGLSTKAVGLRDRNSYSVLLGRFYAEELDQHVTLAQIFWQRDQGQPDRLYAIAERALTISEHFSSFGGDIRELRRRLRAESIELHDTFSSYGAAFRRRLGIGSEQTMDLFHQTISMKTVGNLTDFVREHMLERFEVENKVSALISHFNDLNSAHDAVLTAKDQISRLTPLVADCDAFIGLSVESEEMTACRQALGPWFALLKIELLGKRLATLNADIERADRRIVALTENRREVEEKRDQLREAISSNGGDRIDGIKREIERLTSERIERERRSAQYDILARELGLTAPSDEEHFTANRQAVASECELLNASNQRTQEELTEAAVVERELRIAATEIEMELDSLRGRRSNIPRNMLDLRERLCGESSLDVLTLPFAGELLAVRQGARDWEGAAERVLHGFALSLLVPDDAYSRVAEWVNRTHLANRIVYYRVRAVPDNETVGSLDPDSLVHKLSILPGSSFYRWLEIEIARRFNYVCCDTLARFRREVRAITQAGQIKARGERHEKDDRRRIDDRSNFVLGWSNEEKMAALEKRGADLLVRLSEAQQRRSAIEAQRHSAQARLQASAQLSAYSSFRDLDWRPIALAIKERESEWRELEDGSDVLRTLSQQLAQAEATAIKLDEERTQRQNERSVAGEKRNQAQALHDQCESALGAVPAEAKDRYFPRLTTMRAEAFEGQAITLESADNREREMRDWIQGKIDAAIKRKDRLRDSIVRAMQEYCDRYPADAQELDASVDAAPGYRELLERLSSDDLPRFESRFKSLLNENAIREIANFQSQLNRERQTTAERIESINRSLQGIDYNPGRYIRLEAEQSADAEIRDFQRDLRACTEGTLTGSDDRSYDEAKFLQVRRIIERFRGREGLAELDRRWTHKVTDVRNWQTFSASERWREDDQEHEHYTDSGGKSGGQKEKLAYTVLAASLAYQFGLERRTGRSFRFVAIDEAFGRGSDDSTRYGLELFERLGLQLLIVTPLQKIHVIEPFVKSVAFVHSDGRKSQLHNLTIEEFRVQRAARIV